MNIHIKPDSSGFVWIHRILDSVVPLGLLFAIVVLLDYPWHERYLTMGLASGILFITAAQFTGIYTTWRGRPLYSSFKLILYAWGITWVSLIVLAFLVKESESYSRLITVTWAMTTPLLLIAYRALIRYTLNKIRREGRNQKTVLIIGQGQVGERISNTFKQNPWMGYQVLGYLADETQSHHNHTDYLGNIEQAHSLVNQHKINEVYICLPIAQENKIKQILNDLTDTTAIVKYVPDLFSFDLLHSKVNEINGIPVISVFDTPLSSGSSRLLKRMEDIAFSTAILLLISPILVTVALGVKLTSPGPIFYKQTRIGWNGKKFQILKFRSMPVDVEMEGVEWGSSKRKTTSKFGKFIRKNSLDELPQFVNVLKGDMSIVGPRPERDVFVEQFRKKIPHYMQKHMVFAGMTGWAQVHGWRGDTSIEKRVELDLHYIKNWSLWLDIKIITLTVLKGFINKNSD